MVPVAHKPEYCEIVALGAAAGEYYLGRTATEQRRHRFTRTLDRRPRLLTMVMDRRSVPEMLAEIRPHCL